MTGDGMSAIDTPRYEPSWLSLREDADAAARAGDLVEALRHRVPDGAGLVDGTGLADGTGLVACDLGCGTGAMGRWLAGQLAGPQHWIMIDHDPELLALAATRMPATAADGAPVTVQTRQRNLAALSPDDLAGADMAGADLVAASALLDLLTRDEVDRLAAACEQVGCPALLTLSVTGHVALTPPHLLDGEIAAAFNAHQRRVAGGRRLLGPDATAAAVAAFTGRGAAVLVQASPWQLGPAQGALLAEWLRGWVAAACQQRPELPAADYLRQRLAAASAGELRVVVWHQDLLAYPIRPAA